MVCVSVIMNVQNGEAYLPEALESVLAQTFSDWELIVWDDCSTDNSARIVAGYNDKRIRYFLSPEDTPLGRARALAIDKAVGTWLAFLDQDDIWLPRKLEKQMARIQADGSGRIGLIYGRTLAFRPDGSERDWDYSHEFRPLPEGDIFAEIFLNSGFIAMSSVMLLRAAYDEIGGIPDGFQVIPDFHLFLGIAQRYRAVAVQEIVCRYRLHPGGISLSRRRRILEEALMLFSLWGHCVDSRTLDRRQRTYQTILALDELQKLETMADGLARLLRRGSLSYLLGRPFARMFRAARRMICVPYWKTTGQSL